MELSELIAQYRSDADDNAEGYLSSDADVTLWFNEAQEEAAIRADLLFESTNTDICNIAVTAGSSVYTLHETVIRITRATFTPTGDTEAIKLALIDRTELDRVDPDWRTLTDEPSRLIQDDTRVQLDRLPETNGTLRIECYRTPLVLIEDTEFEKPEIHRIHHRHLVQWVLYRCYSRPDSDAFDKDRADKALAAFTRHFGERPDAKLRRDVEANQPHRNKAWA